MTTRRLSLAATAAACLAATAVLVAAGSGELAGPPAHPREWPDWWAARPPATAAMALVRLAALAAAVYLGLAAVAALAATSPRARATAVVRAVAPLVAPAVWRMAVAGAIVVPQAGPEAPSPPPTMQLLPDGPEAQQPPAPATHTIQPGEHFWAVAEQVMSATLGRPPTDRETAPYWARLVDANRAILVEPGNPDLVLPGQVVTLPPP